MTTHPTTTPAGGTGPGTGTDGGAASRSGSSTAADTTQTAQRAKDTAVEEAGRVGREAKNQARQMWGQTREELTSQASTQQERISTSLRELGDQLRRMAQSGDQGSPARGFVEDAARYASDAASWLEEREPGSVLDEVRGVARRRPGAFLAAAAGLGLVAGRLSRGLADEARDSGSGSGQQYRSPGLSQPSTGGPGTDPGYTGTTTPTGEGLPAAGAPVTSTMPTPSGASPVDRGGERGLP